MHNILRKLEELLYKFYMFKSYVATTKKYMYATFYHTFILI